MTLSMIDSLPEDRSGCDDCDSPKGGFVCRACADEQAGDVILDMKAWLVRQKTVAPGLTHVEVAIVERLIADLEGR